MQWNEKYQELTEFYKEHGHLRMEYGSSLRTWMTTQRYKRTRSHRLAPLTDMQIQKLDEIQFPWDPKEGRRLAGAHRTKWNRNYEELVEFYKQHGHLMMVEYDSSLYRWMLTQRKKRRGIKGHAPLTEEQIQLLDEIDFPWDPIQDRSVGLQSARWISKYQELAEFYKQHGHLKVEYRGDLYMWMIVQRRKLRGSKGHAPLTDEQIQLLNDIHFPWEQKYGRPAGSKNITWNSRYQELAKFYKQHGHLKVEKPGSLYQWMVIQRRKRNGILNGYAPLTDEQIQLLDEIDFDWSSSRRSRTN